MKIVTICLKNMLEIIRFQQFYVTFIKTKSIDTL